MIFKLGVDKAAGAVAKFKAAGGTLAEVAAIRTHYEQSGGAYSPGALFYRLANHQAGSDAGRLWPAKKEVAELQSGRVAKLSERRERGQRALAIVTTGRKARQTDEQIMAALAAEGLAWSEIDGAY